MVSNEAFRKLALSFQGVSESPHFEKNSFRINNKIFVTHDVSRQRACVKLSEIDQSVFCAIDKSIIYPVDNKWGKQGWTLIELTKLKTVLLKDILSKAYEHVSKGKSSKN